MLHRCAVTAVTSMAALLLAAGAARAQDTNPPPAAIAATSTWHIVDVSLVGTNLLRWGTNTIQTAALTNRVDPFGRDVDALVLHTPFDSPRPSSVPASVLLPLVWTGKNILVSDEPVDEGIADGNGDGVRTVTFSTTPLMSLGGRDTSGSLPLALRSDVDIDTHTGEYSLREVEVGLWGESLWLLHTLRQEQDDGSVGFEFRATW
jgi:hypothetical protein